MAETVVLNPPGGGAALTLTSSPYGLLEHSYPVPAPEAQWASSADTEGALLAGQRPPNRELTFRVECRTKQALVDLQAAVGAFRTRTGGTVVRTPEGWTNSVTFDALLPGPFDPVFDHTFDLGGVTVVAFSLTCKPYARGTEVTGPSVANSSAPVLILDVPDVPGDVEAETTLVITESATQNRRYVQWGAGPDVTNALIIDSDSLMTTGFGGTQTTRTGAYDPDVAGNNAISASVGDEVAVCGTGALGHRGTFRVFARVQASAAAARVRLSWQNNDGPFTANRWATIRDADTWEDVDLGLISLDETDVGTQEWSGRLIGRSADPDVAQATLYVDFVALMPVDHGYGVARAVSPNLTGVLTAFDHFSSTTSGGNLNGRASPAGGSWVTSGAATDFQFIDALAATNNGSEAVSRSVASSSFRYGVFGSAMTDQQVSATVGSEFDESYWASVSGMGESGVILRWTDSSNYLRFTFRFSFNPSGSTIYTNAFTITKVVTGVETVLASASKLSFGFTEPLTLRCTARASGSVLGEALTSAGSLLMSLSASDSSVATSGALASGSPGIIDSGDGTNTLERFYDSVIVYTPPAEDFTLYSGQSFRVPSHGRVERENAAGTTYGKPSSWEGQRVLLRPGDNRVAVRATRLDITTAAYSTIDDELDAQAIYTPRYLTVPNS